MHFFRVPSAFFRWGSFKTRRALGEGDAAAAPPARIERDRAAIEPALFAHSLWGM